MEEGDWVSPPSKPPDHAVAHTLHLDLLLTSVLYSQHLGILNNVLTIIIMHFYFALEPTKSAASSVLEHRVSQLRRHSGLPPLEKLTQGRSHVTQPGPWSANRWKFESRPYLPAG